MQLTALPWSGPGPVPARPLPATTRLVFEAAREVVVGGPGQQRNHIRDERLQANVYVSPGLEHEYSGEHFTHLNTSLLSINISYQACWDGIRWSLFLPSEGTVTQDRNMAGLAGGTGTGPVTNSGASLAVVTSQWTALPAGLVSTMWMIPTPSSGRLPSGAARWSHSTRSRSSRIHRYRGRNFIVLRFGLQL